MLPPVSVPMPAGNTPAAMPLPVPDDEPPVHVDGFHGLRGSGNGMSRSG